MEQVGASDAPGAVSLLHSPQVGTGEVVYLYAGEAGLLKAGAPYTGSQDLALLGSVSQSLAGRTAVMQLLPLARSEIVRWLAHACGTPTWRG